ncbi:hypothetical protein KSF78_0004340 [Schistosoma japonicum]|nr:hypothetical protein KSF78_0004340 [Schistosoma japonicum]
MQSNEGSRLSRLTRPFFGSHSSKHSSNDTNLKKHSSSVESTKLPPPPPPPPRYPLKNDGFSPPSGYIVPDAAAEQTPKSPPRTSSLRPKGSRDRVLQPVTSECQNLKKPQIISSCNNNVNSGKHFSLVDRPVRPFNLSSSNIGTPTTSSNSSTSITTTLNNNEKSLKTIDVNKNKVDSLCRADPRSTPLLSRLLAPGFATSLVSSTNSPPSSSPRKGSDQSYTSSENNDRSPGLSSSNTPIFLSKIKRKQGIEFGLINSNECSRKNNGTSSWPGKSETPILQQLNKNQSPHFQPSPDSQCWRIMTSVQSKNNNNLLLPRHSSSNTCSSATQDEMESSIDSPGIFNRGRSNVEYNDQDKMYEKGDGEFSTNASISGDPDYGRGSGCVDDDDDHHLRQTPPNGEEMESNTRSDDQADDNNDDDACDEDDVNVDDNMIDTGHDAPLPCNNDETITANDNNNDNNNDNSTQMMMIHRSSHSYVNESQALFALHEEQERYRQQQHDNDHYHHHHHDYQPNEDKQLIYNYTDSGQKVAPQLILPNSSQEPCDFEVDCPDYSNRIPSETGDMNSQDLFPPPPPPPPPYKVPDHLQPIEEPMFMNNPWLPSAYHHPYSYSQLPHPHPTNNYIQNSNRLLPIGQYDAKHFVPNSAVLPKSPAFPVFENPNNLLFMKQNYYPPESLSIPYPPGVVLPKRPICPQNKEEFSRIMKSDIMPPMPPASSQAHGFPIRWCCHRGPYMLPCFPPTSFNNLSASCTPAAFVLTTTTSHICSLATAYDYTPYNRDNNNNNQNQLFVCNCQPELLSDSVPVIEKFGQPELFPSSLKSEPTQNISQMDYSNLLKENHQLKQRLIDLNVRLQYIDELESHVQQLSSLVDSMVLSHQRQCELNYQLQIYSPLSAPVGINNSDFHRYKIPPNSSSSSPSAFGLNNDYYHHRYQCPINHFHNMPANPGSLPVMPTNMSNCRTHSCTGYNMTRRVTQPNIMSPRFYGPCLKQTVQPEKFEQRIPMLNSTKRSLYPHLVGSMDPRTVSLDRASQPRNSCTTFPLVECNCIRCPLHETFSPPHSIEHAYVNTTITRDGAFSTPNVSMLIPNSPCFSPSYHRRRCAMKAGQYPLLDNESQLLPHSSAPCSPPPRLPSMSTTFHTNKLISNPTIKITDENKNHSTSKESIQPIVNKNGKVNNRPTGLNFMTEKSEILDDSQMLLKHLSPNSEFQCVSSCTVVTTCQLMHCYPVCIVDRVPANGINNTYYHHESKITTTCSSNSSVSTTITLTSTTFATTTATVDTCSSVSSISTKSTIVNRPHHQQQQLKEKSCLTRPKYKFTCSKTSKKSSIPAATVEHHSQQQQNVLSDESTKKRLKQQANRLNTTTKKKYTSTTVQHRNSACSSNRASNEKAMPTASTSDAHKLSDNQDADYSGSYEGVSNSNSSHSQSSEASSLEPDSTLSEGLSPRKHYAIKHSVPEQKNSTTAASSSSYVGIHKQSSKMFIPDMYCPHGYLPPDKLKNSSIVCKDSTSLISPMHSCPNSTVSTVGSSASSNVIPQVTSFNPNINMHSVQVNSPTSFTPCHSADPNSMTYSTSIAGPSFTRIPHMMMITSQCYGTHLPSPSNYTTGNPLGLLNHQTFTSNHYNLNRPLMNTRPSLSTIPQKPSHQVRFAPPTRMNLYNSSSTSNNNTNNKRLQLNPSFGSPIFNHTNVNQSSTINSIVSPHLLRKQYYYYE